MNQPGSSAPRRLLCLTLSLVFLALTAPLAPAQGAEEAFGRRVDRYIGSYPAWDRFSGVVLAAIGDRIVFEKGYGFADAEHGAANSADTRFQVGSITKALTAVLVLRLVERGVLRLDGVVCDYLPEYPPETGRRITVRHLLTHTSGIPHHIDAYPDYWKWRDKTFHAPGDLWRLFAGVPLAHEPGAKYTYSSPGFYLLGAIAQRAAGRSYAELLNEHVFGPAGMTASSVENNRTIRPGRAVGYKRGLSGLVRAGVEDKSTALAAGDLVSTARDLFRFDRALKSGALLTPASTEVLFGKTFPGDSRTPGGWVLRVPYDGGRKTLVANRVSGDSAGFIAAMDRQLEPDGCVVVLSNDQDAAALRIVDDVSDMLLRSQGVALGSPAPEEVETAPAPAADASAGTEASGFYASPDRSITGIVRDGGRTFRLVYAPGPIPIETPILELIPEGPGAFRAAGPSGMRLVFSREGKDGRPSLATSFRGRDTGTLPRVVPPAVDFRSFAGDYSSVELQRTFRFAAGPAGLTARDFLGTGDVALTPLDEDLFGFEKGFVRFTRARDGAITGFTAWTKDTDFMSGSTFVRL